MVSSGDTVNSLHILQLPPGEGEGGVLPKVGFGFREENWSLEIWGGGVFCQRSDLDLGKKIGVWNLWGGGGGSAKGQIWTRGRKLEFGNLGRGGCCVPNFSQFGQKILEARVAFASQIVSHICGD